MQKHDWEAVREALEDLLEDSKRNESWATNFHDAIQAVLDGLPEDGEEF